jgi:co-chaperonin GroES (HSP10)
MFKIFAAERLNVLRQKMKITADNKLKKLIVVGDRVLIKPTQQSEKTASGLYLPPGVQEKEKIQSGYVIKVGPGYPLPLPADEDEMWKGKDEQVKYLPLQAQEGDLAIFLQKGAIEVMYEDEKYFIVPQASILMLEREEDL